MRSEVSTKNYTELILPKLSERMTSKKLIELVGEQEAINIILDMVNKGEVPIKCFGEYVGGKTKTFLNI
jgi:hypothetical protein